MQVEFSFQNCEREKVSGLRRGLWFSPKSRMAEVFSQIFFCAKYGLIGNVNFCQSKPVVFCNIKRESVYEKLRRKKKKKIPNNMDYFSHNIFFKKVSFCEIKNQVLYKTIF